MKKYFSLFICTFLMMLFINVKAYGEDLIVSEEVYVSGPTFGLVDTDSEGKDPGVTKLKASLNFNYEWVTKGSNEEYNIDLAKAGILLATDMYNDTYVSNEDGATLTKEALKEKKESYTEAIELLNLDHYEYISYREDSMNDQDLNDVAGVSIGHKYVTIDGTNYTVFIAVLDITQGEKEWKSNLDIGADTDDYYGMTNTTRDDHLMWLRKYNHKGFDVASTRAKLIIDTYIPLYQKDGYINTLFICGHSRGGAISNILGSLYEDDENIKSYTYTFGTPCTVEVGKLISENKVKSYKTIFNHVNEDDFVTLVPNESWGFRRYGKTLNLKLSEYDDLTNLYKTITDSEYNSPIMHETDPEAEKGLADALGNLITDRNQVYAKQKKTLVFDSKEDKEDYYNDISLKVAMGSTDKYSIISLDDYTIVEEYYYQIFLDAIAGALGNRSDLGLLELMQLLNTLSLVSQDFFDISDEAVVTFSLPYYLEYKLYDAEMSIVKNIGKIPAPHMTAAYIIMSFFRDARDLNVSYTDTYTYTGEEIKPEITLTSVDKNFIEGEDYEVSYSNNIEKSNNAKITINSVKDYPLISERNLFYNTITDYYLIGQNDKYFTIKAPVSSTSKKYKANSVNNALEKISGTGKKGSKRTITPIEGRKVASIVVTDKDGNEIDVTLNEDGTYSFIQPASNVNVEVNYKNREIILTIGSTFASVDGEKSNLDVCPVIRNDRTMLPIRFVAENLGAKVDWNEKNPNTVIITRGDTIIEITIGSDKMIVNGKEITLDTAAFIENDRTYLPVRAISEALNAVVLWNEEKPNEVKIFEMQ